MSKIPLWRYFVIVFVIIVASIYSIPNFYGEVPAIQISSIENTAISNSTITDIHKIF